ncbi:hypothetical protein ElyMa_003497300 [Elysia marginata]|uniref:Uncharacterized protein n=1 Tax=Elysia marginata TaxID=1093978 RepID=A0AAV4EEV3_9GAST|nr:hypothetical protein ElyMa_003497300 [Elysia marginata]
MNRHTKTGRRRESTKKIYCIQKEDSEKEMPGYTGMHRNGWRDPTERELLEKTKHVREQVFERGDGEGDRLCQRQRKKETEWKKEVEREEEGQTDIQRRGERQKKKEGDKEREKGRERQRKIDWGRGRQRKGDRGKERQKTDRHKETAVFVGVQSVH